jgi:hypothetical protein
MACALIVPTLMTAAAGDRRPGSTSFTTTTRTDAGEFVEIVLPSDFTELAAVRLTLYNGGDGKAYGSGHLLDSFTPGDTVSGYSVYSKAVTGIQNGGPDGMSLDIHGSVVEFLSYEGAFQATSGPAAGLFSVDIGVNESDTAGIEGGALGLMGQGGDARLRLGGAGRGQPRRPESRPDDDPRAATRLAWRFWAAWSASSDGRGAGDPTVPAAGLSARRSEADTERTGTAILPSPTAHPWS